MKAYFKGCDVKERALFKYSNCILPISVGQELQVHEGEKLLATLNLVNKSFKSCTLLIDDTIQRHTLRIFSEESDDVLFNKALADGDNWLKRNKLIYEILKINYNVTRWSAWLNHPDYLPQRAQIDKLYSINADYKVAIDLAIKSYIERAFIKKNLNFKVSHAYECCLNYLLEECAVMCLWAQENYDFELYPSGRNSAMKATHENFIAQNNNFGKLISVSLYFRK